MSTKYMHTLGGQPAYFDKQLWYAQHGVPLKKLLVSDLKTIRKQQALSNKYRMDNGMIDTGYGARISYLRIKV